MLQKIAWENKVIDKLSRHETSIKNYFTTSIFFLNVDMNAYLCLILHLQNTCRTILQNSQFQKHSQQHD